LALAILVPACTRLPPPVLLPEVAVEDPAFAATVAAYTDAPVAGGNTVDILLNGDQVFPAQLAAIANARRTITYAQYFWADGAVADALVDALTERCRAGVGVDVLLDGFGALTMSREAVERLRGAGCSVAFFRPLSALLSDPINHRGHRRVLVVDGRVAFTGGVGIGDKWTGNGRLADHWRDTDVRVRGPVVRYLQRAFADSWYEATGVRLGGRAYFPPLKAMGDVTAQVVTSPPERGDVSVHTALLLAIAGARHSILITDPYFVPDRQLTDALLAAVARGVHVAVLTPGEIDANIVRRASRRMLGPLLQAGVKIYEYRAGLLHAKTMVIDGLWSTVGTANLDPRSFAINDEVTVVMYDRAVAARLATIFTDDVRYARRLDYRRWRARPLWQRLLEVLALPFASEL
jgi:cardiolipin synthase